jgi:hypothetical protein
MPMRDAAPLVSLLGHELRAPAGVIGGYLTLIERALDRLTPEQQQAVAGARRAQHRLVEILDDASRLTAAWRADAPAPLALAADTLIADVRATAAAQGLALTASTNIEAPLRVTASRAAVAEALVAVAAAVAREHGADVRFTVSSVPNGLVACHVRVASGDAEPADSEASHEPFNVLRPGLGLRLVVAATALVHAGAHLDEVLVQGRRVGVDVVFPVSA